MKKTTLSTLNSPKNKSSRPKPSNPRIGDKSVDSGETIAQASGYVAATGEDDEIISLFSEHTFRENETAKRVKTLAKCALRNWIHSQTLAERSAVQDVIDREDGLLWYLHSRNQTARERQQAIGIETLGHGHISRDYEKRAYGHFLKIGTLNNDRTESLYSSRMTDELIRILREKECADSRGNFVGKTKSEKLAAEIVSVRQLLTINRGTRQRYSLASYDFGADFGIAANEKQIRARLFAQRDKLVSRSRKLTSDSRSKPYRQDTSWLENVTDEQRDNLKTFGQLYTPKTGKQSVLDFFGSFNCQTIGTLNHKTGGGIASIVDIDVDTPQFHEFAKRLARRLAVREGVPVSMVSGAKIKYRNGFASMLEKQAKAVEQLAEICDIESTESIDVKCDDGTTKTVDFVTVERDEKSEKQSQNRIESAANSIQRKADKEKQTHEQSEYVQDVLAECVLLQLQCKAGERPFGFAAVRRLVRRYVQRLGIDRVKRDVVARLNLTNAALAEAKPETIGNQDIWIVGKGIESDQSQPKRGMPAAQIESAYVPTDPLSELLERGGLKQRLADEIASRNDIRATDARIEFSELLASEKLTEAQKVFLLQFIAMNCNQTDCGALLGIGQDAVSKRLATIRAIVLDDVEFFGPAYPVPNLSTRADDMRRRVVTVGIDNRRESGGTPITPTGARMLSKLGDDVLRLAYADPSTVQVRHYVAKTR